MLPLDLHVLSLPLAFILSQDQTLHCIKNNVLLESWLLNFLKGIWQINTTFLFLSILPVIQRTNLKKSRDFPSRFGLQRYVIFFNPPNLFSRTFAFSFFAPSSENRIKLLFEQLFFSNADAKVGIILESANVLMIFCIEKCNFSPFTSRYLFIIDIIISACVPHWKYNGQIPSEEKFRESRITHIAACGE